MTACGLHTLVAQYLVGCGMSFPPLLVKMKGNWRRAEMDEDGDWYRPEQPRLFWYFSPAPFILLSLSSSMKFPS